MQLNTTAPVVDGPSPRSTERGSLRWYWNRLRVMPPAEALYRAAMGAGRLAQQGLHDLGLRAPLPVTAGTRPVQWLAAAHMQPLPDAARAIALADALLAGRWQRLDGGMATIGLTPSWQDAGVAGEDDVRHLMELHRHAHLVHLAQAHAATGDTRYRDVLFEHLQSWFAACPFAHGTAWASALDAALRLLNWSIVWQLLGASRDAGAALPPALRARWLDNVYLHAQAIRLNLSRHSSANNHLIGELVGLAAADATWPFWPRLRQWGRRARTQLARETLRQNAPDGGNREQASWYQAFVFELLAVHLRMCSCAGWPVAPQVRERLGAMARFAAALRDRSGHLSHHGDADGATALPLAVEPDDDCIDAMIGLAVALDLAPELAPLLRRPAAKAAWLLGAAAAPVAADAAAVRRSLPRRFDDSGLYLLGERFGAAGEVTMTLDAGPIGYLAIAAHGHADALSLRLSVDGAPLLVDRGTGSYNTEPQWRHFFRSTPAHNTLSLDGEDQSVYGGPFLWLSKARCRLHEFASSDDAGVFEASHDGWQRLAGRPRHTRRVEWHAAPRRFMVTDSVSGRGRHALAIAWHADPACRVICDEGGARIERDGVAVRLRVDAGPPGEWSLHCGDPAEQLGWHSPAFGRRVAAPTLVWRASIAAPACITTTLEIERTPTGGKA